MAKANKTAKAIAKTTKTAGKKKAAKAKQAAKAKPAKKAAKAKPAKKAAKAKPAEKAAKAKQAAKAKPAKQAAKAPAKKSAKPAAGGKTVESYTSGFSDWRGDVLAQIGSIVSAAAPGAKASIKWAQPVFEHNGPFAFMRAHSKHVNLGFWRGKELDDPDGRLESGGQRMAHVKIGSVEDIDESQFSSWVRQAIALNDAKGDPTKRAR